MRKIKESYNAPISQGGVTLASIEIEIFINEFKYNELVLPSGLSMNWRSNLPTINNKKTYLKLDNTEQLFIDGILFGAFYALDRFKNNYYTINLVNFFYGAAVSNEAVSFVLVKAIWKSLNFNFNKFLYVEETKISKGGIIGDYIDIKFCFEKARFPLALGRNSIPRILYDKEYDNYSKESKIKIIKEVKEERLVYWQEHCQ